jgi:3-hydroxyisobutyrate dehydrogenase-like beta-hydroxyacid dehydrogenase
MQIGFIGMGLMGKGFVTNLLKAKHNVVAYDINKDAVEWAVKAGAKEAKSPKEIAEACRVVCTSLPGPNEIEPVVLGENGIFAGAKSGDIYIDLSTNSPTLIRKIAAIGKERGIGVLDAPLTGGGANVAWTKGHTALVGGEKEVLEKANWVFEAICKDVCYCGKIGNGMVVKLINNYCGAVCYDLVFEALSLAKKEGVDLKIIFERLSTVIFGSSIRTWLPLRVFAGNFEPLFTIDMMYKDTRLALEEGRMLDVPLYHGGLTVQRMIEARARGLGQKDLTALALMWEELLDIKIRL